MLQPHDIPGTHYDVLPIAAIAAGDATAKVAVWAAPFKCEIQSIEHVPSAAITGDNTNSRNLNAQLADATEIANLDYATGEHGAAGTANAFTLSGTTAQKTLAAGAGLLIESEKVGNGLAFGASAIRIGYKGV